MGQEVFINFDVEDLKNARCRAADDLRIKKFAQLVSGDSTVYDLFLTGSSGLLNIQDYAAVRMGVGNLNQRPDSGNYTIGGSETLSYNHSAAELEAAIETITGNSCTVVQLTNFVFKITFDSVGAETVPSIDSGNLVPSSSVTATVLTEGDATNQEQWLWRIYRNALAFTDSFTNISGQGIQGTLSLATPGIYDLLANGTNVQTNFEIEATDTTGNVQTIAQIPIKLNGEVIGTGFEGTVPSARTLDPSAVSFLNSFPDPEIVGTLTSGGIDCLDFGGDGDIVIKPDNNNTQPDAHDVNITGGYRTGSEPYNGGAVNITGGAGNGGAGGDVIIASGSGGGASGSQVDISSDTKVEIDAPTVIMRASSDFSVIGNATFGESVDFEKGAEFKEEVIIADLLTINAEVTPDEDAKIELVDKSTGATKKGGLYKRDGSLYVGTFTDYLKNPRFSQQGTGQVLDFPVNSGIRFHNGDFLNHYSEGNFSPKLESGDGTVVQSDYQVRQANYVRVGDTVQMNIFITINDFASDWKTSTKQWRLTGLPYSALGNHNIEVRPLKGWLNLGNDNITGALQSGNDYLWFEKFVDGGSTPGEGVNTDRISASDFTVHPFDFTSGSGRGFSFVVTGSFRANPESPS